MPAQSPGYGPDQPSRARIFSYWLGGTDYTAADRAEADRIERLNPGVRRMLADNRAFAARAASWAVTGSPIVQVIDLDAGFPGAGNLHQVVQQARPDARFAYVTADPEVADIWDVRLAERQAAGAVVAGADWTDPDAVLGYPALKGVIDLDAPMAVLCTLALNVMAPAAARRVAAGWVKRIAPGSVVVITAPRIDDQAMQAKVAAAWMGTKGWNFTRAQFSALFAGLELVPPGIGTARSLDRSLDRMMKGLEPLNVCGGANPGPVYVLAGIGIKR